MAKPPARSTSAPQPAGARDRRRGSRAQARRAAQRRTRLVVVGVVVLAIALALVVALVAGGDGKSATGPTVPADAAAIVQRALTIPPGSLDQAGTGSVDATKLLKLNGDPLALNGKPELLYVGAEYCPFCAAQRWAMVIALSRFGTFSDLGLTYSASNDVHADTPTFSFHGSSYSSEHLAFTAVETNTREPDGKGGYTALDAPTPAQQALLMALNPQGGIPFLDFGGRYAVLSSLSDPGLIAGETHAYVLGSLSKPASMVGRDILGAANLMTAAICTLTNQQPTAVCTSAGVVAAAERLP